MQPLAGMSALSEIRQTFRRLSRHPGGTILVILTLAIGIAATTAVVTTIRGVLFDPLPFPEDQRLVSIREVESEQDFGNLGFQTYLDLKESSSQIGSMSAVAMRSYTLTGAGDAVQLDAIGVTHDLFRTFRVRPILGRDFTAADDVPDAARVVLLSHELWVERFGGDPEVVGRPVTFDGSPVEVIGVMPPGTRIREGEWRGSGADAWVPLRYASGQPRACRSCRHIRVYGRLADGASLESASREIEALTDSFRRQYPEDYPPHGFTRLVPLREAIVGRMVTGSLWILLAVAAMVLIIAMANAGNLALAGFLRRRNELAIRRSLGASRGRIVRQILGETLFQALVASAIGVPLAAAAIGWIRASAGVNLPRAADLRLDWGIAGIAVLLALVSGLVTGMIPAWRTGAWLRHGTRVSDDQGKTRAVLVGTNIALSFILVSASVLLLRSVTNLFSIDPGFEPAGVLTFQAWPGSERWDEPQEALALYDRLIADLSALPGVSVAAITTQLPFAGNTDNASLHAEDRPDELSSAAPDAHRFGVTPGYLEAIRLPLQRGRFFTRDDTSGSEPVVVLNETAARVLWPDADPIGRRVRVAGGDDNPFRTVVGIVGDVRHGDLGADVWPQAYVPLSQFPWGPFIAVVRTSGSPESLIAPSREVVRRIDPEIPIYSVTTLESLVAGSEALRKFLLALLGAFALVAVALSMIGIYGILAFAVASRRREVGIRMALGATASRVVGLVLSQGMTIVVLALLVGLAGAVAAGRFLESLLFGVTSRDLATLALTFAGLAFSALLASMIPAWRASRVDPNQALREE